MIAPSCVVSAPNIDDDDDDDDERVMPADAKDTARGGFAGGILLSFAAIRFIASCKNCSCVRQFVCTPRCGDDEEEEEGEASPPMPFSPLKRSCFDEENQLLANRLLLLPLQQ